MSTHYYLVEGGVVTGPHSLLVLRQKAEIHALRPDAMVHPLLPADAPWCPLHEIPDLLAAVFPAPSAPRLALSRPTLPNTASDADLAPTEVPELLRDNVARQVFAESGIPLRKLKPLGAKRRRDFLVLFLLGNAFALGSGYFLGFNGVQGVFILSFCAVFNVSLYWVLFHVMDRY